MFQDNPTSIKNGFIKPRTIILSIVGGLLSLLMVYVLWSFIGVFYAKEYWRITWRLHIAFAFFISSLIWLPFFFFYKIYSNRFFKQLLLASTSVLLLFPLIEAILCIMPINKTHTEKQGFTYTSPYLPVFKNVFHLLDTASPIEHVHHFPEFIQHYRVNKLGFSGKEWTRGKPKNKIRIISLGDSFTMGVGGAQDSTYPALLGKILGEDYEVLNAGVLGSDPVFDFKKLEKLLPNYTPDIVLQAISTDDIDPNWTTRGGFERFVGDSILRFKKPPFYEPLYAISYFSRLFFDPFRMTPGVENNHHAAEVIEEKNKIMIELLNRYEQLAVSYNFEVRIVFFPQSWDMERQKYVFDFAQAKEQMASLKHVKPIDLMPCYQDAVGQNQELIYKYYWKQDRHHNSTGYQLMARCIAEQLMKN